MATRDLRDELAAIPGVSDAEITVADDSQPVATVWLDGTRDGEEVRERIESLLGQSIPALHTIEGKQGSRSGLGKGLETLLPDVVHEPVPAQLRGSADPSADSIDRVAVVETHGSVVVELEDGSGSVYTAAVDRGGSIDHAVLDAVRQMLEPSDETMLKVVDLVSDRTDLVVVEAVRGEARGAGASHVEFGRPYAVALAAHRALNSL